MCGIVQSCHSSCVLVERWLSHVLGLGYKSVTIFNKVTLPNLIKNICKNMLKKKLYLISKVSYNFCMLMKFGPKINLKRFLKSHKKCT